MLIRPPPSGASTSGTLSGTSPPIPSNTDLVRVGARFGARVGVRVGVRWRVRWRVRVGGGLR